MKNTNKYDPPKKGIKGSFINDLKNDKDQKRKINISKNKNETNRILLKKKSYYGSNKNLNLFSSLVSSNQKMINCGKIIKIRTNNSLEEQEIEIKENTRRFTNKCLDVTMIEVEKNNSIKY